MTRNLFAVLAILLVAPLAAKAADEGGKRLARPNILFIIADDIGYGDLSCYGATKVKTPRLDRLAAEGCRFTDAHTTATTCTPTRYALLTGQYAWRHEPGSQILRGDAPLGIPADRETLPAMLRRAGYATGLVGKWHLGLGGPDGPDYNGELKPGPLEVGFDSAFFIPATGDRVPCVYVEGHRVAGLDPADPLKINFAIERGTPESMVQGVPRIGGMTGGKAALWNDADMADTLAKRAIEFLEQRKDGPFFLYLATHGIHVPRVPHARFRGTSQSGVRGDVIHELDDTVGQVLDALTRLKLERTTLVIFTSDNGGVLDPNGPDRVNAGDETTANGHQPNGPLRGTKGGLFEGGHRVPLITRWPDRIQPGGTNDELFGLVDMMASFATLTQTPLPAGAAPDSLDVLPVLLNEPGQKSPRNSLVFHNGRTNGPFAVRAGTWKLIAQGNRPQLYDLAKDLGETVDVAEQHADKVRELREILAAARAAGQTRP